MPITLTPEERQEIGRRISTLRTMLGMKQAALASKVNVTQPAVSQWEKGHTLPSVPAQSLLADALHTTRSRLFRELAQAEWRATGEAS